MKRKYQYFFHIDHNLLLLLFVLEKYYVQDPNLQQVIYVSQTGWPSQISQRVIQLTHKFKKKEDTSQLTFIDLSVIVIMCMANIS